MAHMQRTASAAKATSVAMTHSPQLRRACACGQHTMGGGKCNGCRDKATSSLQRNATSTSVQSPIPPIVHEVLYSRGQPLDSGTRAFMEPRFNHDFSHVRVHADAGAAESAHSVSALAYTVGSDITFASGRYAPETLAGQRLLAHELTHVVQQASGDNTRSAFDKAVSHPSDAAELEADSTSDRVLSGGAVEVSQQPSALVQGLSTGAEIGIGAGIAAGIGAGLGIAALAGAFNPCPKTLVIPDDIHAAIGEAWKQSGHGGETVAEHGGRVVTDTAGKRAIRTGTGGSGSINLPAEQPGDVTQSTFHTHPYSKSEGSTLGVSFSGGDITNFVAGGQGSSKYIGAGSCYFALNTLDQAKRNACQKEDLNKRWNDSFAKASGTFSEKVETAVNTTIAGCGLCHYKACRPDDKSPVPKTAART